MNSNRAIFKHKNAHQGLFSVPAFFTLKSQRKEMGGALVLTFSA